MPINAYVGWPGAGKTYQVVSNVIIPQIAKGRSIVTNIEGIDVDAVYENIFCQNRDKIVCLGTLRTISNEDVESPLLFPRDFSETEWKKYQTTKSWQSYLAFRKDCGLPPVNDFESIVKPGEMVIIDEAVNWWGNDCSIIPEHGKFFREHRHHVDPFTHESCDLVLIAQEIGDIKRSLRALIQYTFRAEKLDTVGLDKRYKLHMYRGAKIGERSKPLRDELGQYKPEIYECYDSYGGGKGKEKSIDTRHNVLNDKKLKYKAVGMLVAFVLLGGFAFSQLKGLFGGNDKKPVVAEKPADGTGKGLPVVAAGMSGKPEGKAAESSTELRIVGRYSKRGFPVFVLANGEGVYRYWSPIPAVQPLDSMQIVVDGAKVNSWTGGAQKGLLK